MKQQTLSNSNNLAYKVFIALLVTIILISQQTIATTQLAETQCSECYQLDDYDPLVISHATLISYQTTVIQYNASNYFATHSSLNPIIPQQRAPPIFSI